jgi:eukaryotic-like serine/threonine-protein kinase
VWSGGAHVHALPRRCRLRIFSILANAAEGAGEAETVEADSGKDPFDEVLKRVVTGGQPSTLARGTVLSGRFRIERMIGAGGMGAVYIARDDKLGREVAIKVHHTPGGAVRLRREAIAMARLAHPNVVTVFEVGELGAYPFVVMEYVPGTTLRAWLGEQRRPVAEILAVVLAAGDGLAAAHAAGLIHRDIKPENILIGADGRARVGDFGLARDHDSQEPDAAVELGDAQLGTVTQTGALLGTPAYMAPEQLTGVIVDPRADQFAFCITLWEALWRERPFAGATLPELAEAMRLAKRRAPPAAPRVPNQIRQALERGLAPEPQARFAGMPELLAALRAPRRRRTRIAIAAALAAVASGLAALALPHGQQPGLACAAEARSLAMTLPLGLPQQVRALGKPEAADRLATILGAFSDRLTRGSVQACEAATVRHAWSPELLAKAQACLQTAARTATALVTAEPVTAERVPALVHRAAHSLPDLGPCTSQLYLAATPALPADLAARDALIEARTDLDLARSEIAARRVEGAQRYLDRVTSSPARDSPSLAQAILVVRAQIAAERSDQATAAKLAADAYYAARAHDDDEATALALGVLLDLEINHAAEDPSAPAWTRTARADADRIAGRAPWLAANLYMQAATVAEANDDAPGTLRDLAQARALAEPEDHELLESLALLEGSVDLWTGKVAEGVALYERTIDAMTARLGHDDSGVGVALTELSRLLSDAGQYERALAPARRAVAILERSTDPTDRSLGDARINLAAALVGGGHADEARELLETARTEQLAHPGDADPTLGIIDENLGLQYLDDNDTSRALALLEEALADTTRAVGPDRTETADVLYNLSVAQRKAKQLAVALATARRCADIYGARRPGTMRHLYALDQSASLANDLHQFSAALSATATVLALPAADDPQARPWAQLEQGRALIGLGRAVQARPVLAAARASYAAIPEPDRVAEIDALLARTRQAAAP